MKYSGQAKIDSRSSARIVKSEILFYREKDERNFRIVVFVKRRFQVTLTKIWIRIREFVILCGNFYCDFYFWKYDQLKIVPFFRM